MSKEYLSKLDPGYHELIGRKFRKPPLKLTPEELWARAYEYFDFMRERAWKRLDVMRSGDLAGSLVEVPIPTPFSLQTLCTYVGISDTTFQRYSKSPDYTDFHDVCHVIKQIIDAQHLEGGLTAIYHPGMAARLLGLVDKQDVTSGGDKLAPPVITFKKTEE